MPARYMPTIAACTNGLKALTPCVYDVYPSLEPLRDARKISDIARRMSKHVDITREAAEGTAQNFNKSFVYYNWATAAHTILLNKDVFNIVLDNYEFAVECFKATKEVYAEIQEAPSMVLELSAGTFHVAMHAKDADLKGARNNKIMVAMCIDLEESVLGKALDASQHLIYALSLFTHMFKKALAAQVGYYY